MAASLQATGELEEHRSVRAFGLCRVSSRGPRGSGPVRTQATGPHPSSAAPPRRSRRPRAARAARTSAGGGPSRRRPRDPRRGLARPSADRSPATRRDTHGSRGSSARADRRVGEVDGVEPARPRRREPPDPLERRGLERRDDGTLQARSAAGRQHIDGAAPRVALQLDIEERAARDGGEHIGEGRHAVTLECVGVRSSTRASMPWTRSRVSSWITTGNAVGGRPHVELEAVAARHGERGQERRERVLGCASPVTAMCQAQRHRPRLPDRQVGRRCPRWSDG